MGGRAVLAGVDLVATATALVAFAALHVRSVGVNPVRDPVSRYGIGRHLAGYRTLTIALGVAGMAAAGIAAIGPVADGRALTVALLAVFAVCRVSISWFPMDLPGAIATAHGRVHRILAVGAFAAAVVACHRIREGLEASSPSATAEIALLQMGFWAMALGLVAMLAAALLRTRLRFFGAAERVVYLGVFTMLAAVGLAAL